LRVSCSPLFRSRKRAYFISKLKKNNESPIENIIVNSVTKSFNIFMSSLIMPEIVVDLLHFVVLRIKPFDSCAAGYHGDGKKE